MYFTSGSDRAFVLIIAAIFFFLSHKIAVMAYQEKDIT